MLAHIDEAWTSRVNEISACGGKWAKAKTIDPRTITVTIEAAPFTIPFYGPTATFSGTVLDGNKVKVAVAHVPSSGTFLQNYKDLLRWEFGNLIQVVCDKRPTRVEDELGTKSPCGK